MNKTFQVITLNQHIYGIDPEAEIKEGDWYYNQWAKVGEQIDNNSTSTGRELVNLHKTHPKIVFSSDESLGLPVPVIEDGISELAIEYRKKYPLLSSDIAFAFADGYQANPCKFTEEDMRKCALWFYGIAFTKDFDKSLSEFLSSLKPEIVSMEVEMRMGAIVEPVLCIKTDDSNRFIPVKINYTSLGEK